MHHLSVSTADGTRLYHTMTGEMILLERHESWEQLRNELIMHRFLVANSFNELAYVNKIRMLIGMSLPHHSRSVFTVFTTTDCNARCFYCYEKGRKRIAMTSQTAHDVANYMIRRVANSEPIKIRWFGGEPLLNMDVIRIICQDLSKHGVKFSSTIITNGVYFTKTVAEEAKVDWHLKWAQITLDGTEHVYNRTKAYMDQGNNPYQTVLNNIDDALESGISISIRLNVDHNNYEDIMVLCDTLADRFKTQKGIQVYAAPIRDLHGKKNDTADEVINKVENSLLQLGLYHQGKLSNAFKVNRCMADDDGSVTILPDGRIGKCEHFSETETIGSIYSDEQDQTVIQSWKEQMEDQEECKTCPLYPRCIRLKKCEWEQFGCSKADRQLKIQRLKDQIAKFQPK